MHNPIRARTPTTGRAISKPEPDGLRLFWLFLAWRLATGTGHAKCRGADGRRFFTDGFYVVGGRSADGIGNDLPHPFKYDVGTNTWSIKAATYPDNQVSDMACGVLTDSGTNYIYCVGGSADGQTTATDRVFRYNPITDTIETIASPWPGDSDGITLPGGFAVFNNKLYVLGGFRINTAMTDTIWEFTPGTNTWVQKSAQLPSRSATYLQPPSTVTSTRVEAALGTAARFMIATILLHMTQWLILSPALPVYRGLLAKLAPFPSHQLAAPIT